MLQTAVAVRRRSWIPVGASLVLLASIAAALADPEDAHWWDGFTGPGRLGGWVYSLAGYNDRLVAGGEFTVAGDTTVVYNIAAWNGRSWEKLGSGLRHNACPGFPCWPVVFTMRHFNGDLIVGGVFIRAGGHSANNIARWDGTSWHALGAGMNQAVWALTEYRGELIAGGNFTQADGEIVNYIARWNGYAWRPLGSGFSHMVRALIVHDDTLIAASFAGSVATWDGVEWHSLGTGAVQGVRALAVYDNMLIAAGHFLDPHTYLSYRVGRWNGASWTRFSPGVDPDANDLAIYHEQLVAGCGDGSVLRWDGSAWHPLGSGTNDIVHVLCATDTSLFVGGRFTVAGGKPSLFIARWDDVTTPVAVRDLAAVITQRCVRLSWQLARAALAGLRAIHVQRAEDPAGPYVQCTDLPLLPQAEMTFEDSTAIPDRPHWYRLLLLARTGETSIVGPVRPAGIDQYSRTTLFTPVVSSGGGPISIRYRLTVGGVPLRLEVFSANGRLIRILENGVAEPGEFVRSWDRRTDAGTPISRGAYLVRLTADRTLTKKLVLAHR